MKQEIVECIPALRAFALTLTLNSDAADDLVQETLVKAIASSHQFTPGTSLISWLFTILRNSFYTGHRRRRRERPGVSEDAAAAEIPASGSQYWSQQLHEVRNAMERLPAEHREVLVLVGALGFPYEQVAQMAGCPVGTIKSRLNRARLSLLAALGEETVEKLFHS